MHLQRAMFAVLGAILLAPGIHPQDSVTTPGEEIPGTRSIYFGHLVDRPEALSGVWEATEQRSAETFREAPISLPTLASGPKGPGTLVSTTPTSPRLIPNANHRAELLFRIPDRPPQCPTSNLPHPPVSSVPVEMCALSEL